MNRALRFRLSFRVQDLVEELDQLLPKAWGKGLRGAWDRFQVKEAAWFGGRLRARLAAARGAQRVRTGFLRFGEARTGYYLDYEGAHLLSTALTRVAQGAEVPESMHEALRALLGDMQRLCEGGNAGPVGTVLVAPFEEVYEGHVSGRTSLPITQPAREEEAWTPRYGPQPRWRH